MVRKFPLFRSDREKGIISGGTVQFPNGFSGKLGCYPFSKKNPEISVQGQMERIFSFLKNPFGNCILPLEVVLFFCSERNGGNFLAIC